MKIHAFANLLFLLGISQIAWADPSPELIYQLKGSVVKVHTLTNTGRQGSGVGVVVAKDLVATNCHVLANSIGTNITALGEVHLPVGVRADWKHDVCILRFEFLPLKPVAFGDSEHLTYETESFSIGFPGASPRSLTTTGKIKALYPMDGSFVIRTSASFQMGASGSPLFDANGRLIGMNTFKSPGANGYYYNVPAKWIQSAVSLPESAKAIQTDLPFWDATLELRPYWMQVVLPMQAGKWQDVLTVASAWQKKTPDDPEAIYYFALAQQNLGNVQEAKSKFKRVLQLNPHHTSSVLALAQIAKEQGNQTELKRLSQMLSVLDEGALASLNPAQR